MKVSGTRKMTELEIIILHQSRILGPPVKGMVYFLFLSRVRIGDQSPTLLYLSDSQGRPFSCSESQSSTPIFACLTKTLECVFSGLESQKKVYLLPLLWQVISYRDWRFLGTMTFYKSKKRVQSFLYKSLMCLITRCNKCWTLPLFPFSMLT